MIEAILFDCETTGSSGQDQIIEYAYLELPPLGTLRTLDISKENFEEKIVSKRFRPSVPISTIAFEVHGIKAIDLINEEPSTNAKLPVECRYLVGHNINFDYRFLGKPEGIDLICTWAMAKAVDKLNDTKFTNHKLPTLVQEYVGIDFEAKTYHSAKGDVLANLYVLQKFSQEFKALESWDDMYKFLQSLKKPVKGKEKK